MPDAITSTALGPALFEETIPSVKTDDPEMPSAVMKFTPADHHSMSATPRTSRHSQITNRATMAAGPTKDRTRSRAS